MKRDTDLSEAITRLDMQSWLDRESLDYKVNRGSSGMQLNLRECPDCGDSHYKVYLNQDTGLGNCFKCGITYNKWSFIKAHLGSASNKEVVDHILDASKEFGWRPVKRTSAAVEMTGGPKLPTSFELPHDGRNARYLTNRGITPELATYFKLRYCVRGRFDYELAGKRASQLYDRRILIPIFDLDGTLVSFQGRDITGTAEKKYLFPPGFASTGSHLYNGHNAVGASHIVMGEGAFDVMAIKIALDFDPDLRAVVPVGTFGKHLSGPGADSQLDKLKKLQHGGLRIVTIMWDGERAAYEEAIEVGLMLHSHGFVARVATLPADKDPNEVPGEVVREAFWKAQVVDRSSAVALLMSRQYR